MENVASILAGIVGKDNVITDDQKLVWAKDYTKAFTPNPGPIVFPQTTEQVSDILKYCNNQKIAIVPSGGRTGLSGGAVATKGEIVLSTKRMTQTLGINKIEKTILVQSGVVTKD